MTTPLPLSPFINPALCLCSAAPTLPVAAVDSAVAPAAAAFIQDSAVSVPPADEPVALGASHSLEDATGDFHSSAVSFPSAGSTASSERPPNSPTDGAADIQVSPGGLVTPPNSDEDEPAVMLACLPGGSTTAEGAPQEPLADVLNPQSASGYQAADISEVITNSSSCGGQWPTDAAPVSNLGNTLYHPSSPVASGHGIDPTGPHDSITGPPQETPAVEALNSPEAAGVLAGACVDEIVSAYARRGDRPLDWNIHDTNFIGHIFDGARKLCEEAREPPRFELDEEAFRIAMDMYDEPPAFLRRSG